MLQNECFVPHGDKDVPLKIELPRTSSENIGLAPQIMRMHKDNDSAPQSDEDSFLLRLVCDHDQVVRAAVPLAVGLERCWDHACALAAAGRRKEASAWLHAARFRRRAARFSVLEVDELNFDDVDDFGDL